MSTVGIHRIIDQFSLNGLLASLPAKRLGTTTTVATAAAAAVGVPLLAYLVRCYRGWLALGRGGLPANPLGYAINVACHLAERRDVRAPAPFTMEEAEAAYGFAPPPPTDSSSSPPPVSLARQSFLAAAGSPPPPPRRGPRPDVPTYCIPQRQTSDAAAPAMLARMEAHLAAVAAASAGAVRAAPSGLEGPFRDALWVGRRGDEPPLPRFLRGTRGEFAHPHDEGSTHVVLSLVDATRAIELGWAERHHFSGVAGGHPGLPWGYVLIYAPRDDAEFEVWKAFVAASARFNAAAMGVAELTVP